MRIYFYDADYNIVEFIARKSLNNISYQPFNIHSLLGISEIGIPTSDIKHEYATICNRVKLPIYSGTLERFCSIGDENGLFIIINKEIKNKWFPTKDKAISSDFNISFIENETEYRMKYTNKVLSFINENLG